MNTSKSHFHMHSMFFGRDDIENFAKDFAAEISERRIFLTNTIANSDASSPSSPDRDISVTLKIIIFVIIYSSSGVEAEKKSIHWWMLLMCHNFLGICSGVARFALIFHLFFLVQKCHRHKKSVIRTVSRNRALINHSQWNKSEMEFFYMFFKCNELSDEGGNESANESCELILEKKNTECWILIIIVGLFFYKITLQWSRD